MMKPQWEKSPSLKLTSSCDFSASIYKWLTINVLSLQSSNRYKCNIPSILMMFKQPLTIAKRLQMRFISRIFCSRYLPRSLLELYYYITKWIYHQSFWKGFGCLSKLTEIYFCNFSCMFLNPNIFFQKQVKK